MGSYRLVVERLESRLMLDGAGLGVPADAPVDEGPQLEYQVEGTNWIDFDSRGHKKHVDHVTWDADPGADGLVNVVVLVHDHGNLDADSQARIYDAIAEVNSAAASFGVGLNLTTVTDPSQLHNIHLHEDTGSGCGSSALGCAEWATFVNHTGEFGDGHGNHKYAGEETNGGTAEATILSGFDWYTGADSSLIGSNQYDYQTVVTQELLHLVGLHHDSTVYDTDSETDGNTDRRSVMYGSLGQGIVRQLMSAHDQEDMLKHFYGSGQTTADPDGGGNNGGGKGPPPGKGKNKVEVADTRLAEFDPASLELAAAASAFELQLQGLQSARPDRLVTANFAIASAGGTSSVVSDLISESMIPAGFRASDDQQLRPLSESLGIREDRLVSDRVWDLLGSSLDDLYEWFRAEL